MITEISTPKIKGPSEYVTIEGSFAPDNTDPPTDAKGRGYSVVRDDVGVFIVTFAQVGIDLVYADASLQMETGDGHYAQVGAYDADAKTLVIGLFDDSDAADDLAADANTRIHFRVTFNQSDLLS